MRWRFFLAETMHSIRGNVATTVAASVTVLMMTFLLAVFASLGLWLYDKTVGVRNDVTVKAYLPPHTEGDTAMLNRVHNELAQIPYVKSIKYCPPSCALAQLSKSLQQDATTLPSNPFPPAFYIKLTNPDKADSVTAAALQIPEVGNCTANGGQPPCATYGKDITDKVLTVTKWVLVGLGTLMTLLGVAAVVLIANTIRLSIFSRRREIEVMKLVGASNWFVRVPFMAEGFVQGVIGAGLAFGFVWFLQVLIRNLLNRQHSLLSTFRVTPQDAIGIGIIVLLIGALIGTLGSAIGLRRFLEA